jgi:hypothetical protein
MQNISVVMFPIDVLLKPWPGLWNGIIDVGRGLPGIG